MTTPGTLTVRPLKDEVRATLDTATAAFHLNRRPQTLRAWASGEKGPLQPRRISGRLAWSVDEIRALLCCSNAPTSPAAQQQ
jgi:hypothetical protein